MLARNRFLANFCSAGACDGSLILFLPGRGSVAWARKTSVYYHREWPPSKREGEGKTSATRSRLGTWGIIGGRSQRAGGLGSCQAAMALETDGLCPVLRNRHAGRYFCKQSRLGRNLGLPQIRY